MFFDYRHAPAAGIMRVAAGLPGGCIAGGGCKPALFPAQGGKLRASKTAQTGSAARAACKTVIFELRRNAAAEKADAPYCPCGLCRPAKRPSEQIFRRPYL